MAELKGSVAELEGAKTEVDDQLHASQGEVAELKGNVAELEGAKAELEEQLHASQGEVAELKGAVAELEGAKGEVEEQYHASQGEVAELKGTVAELEGAKGELEEQLQASQGEVAELKGTVHELEGEVATHKENRKKDRAAFKEKEKELTGVIQEREGEVKGLKKKIEEMEAAHAKAIEQWSEKLEFMTRGLDFMDMVPIFDYEEAIGRVKESHGQVAEILKGDSGEGQETLLMIASELEGIQADLLHNQKEYERHLEIMYKNEARIHEVFNLIEIIDGNRILMERFHFVTNLLA
ncbi:MAG: hypothetical protein ACYTHM_14895 [Planctomycetota bacterium]